MCSVDPMTTFIEFIGLSFCLRSLVICRLLQLGCRVFTCHYLFLIASSLDALGKLCFVTLLFWVSSYIYFFITSFVRRPASVSETWYLRQKFKQIQTTGSINWSAVLLNPFLPNGLFYLNFLDKSISKGRGIWLFLLLQCIKKNT